RPCLTGRGQSPNNAPSNRAPPYPTSGRGRGSRGSATGAVFQALQQKNHTTRGNGACPHHLPQNRNGPGAKMPTGTTGASLHRLYPSAPDCSSHSKNEDIQKISNSP